jgi:hypothetical protein
MYALGIPISQYRRTTQVLRHEGSYPIDYTDEKKDNDFYLFKFSNINEYEFKDIVLLLKNNGITTIGADHQLTEKKIMKLVDILKEQGEFTDNSNEKIEGIIDKLRSILRGWQTKQYNNDKERWEMYYLDIQELVEDYEDELSNIKLKSHISKKKLNPTPDKWGRLNESYSNKKKMKKQILSEQFCRMQKLAGIITENLVSETKNPNSFEVDALVNNKETKVLIDYVESNTGSFPKKVTIEWERDRDDMSNRPVRSKQDDENSDYAKYWIEDHAEDLEFKPEDFIEDPSNPDEPEMLFTAISKDKMWEFAVNVLVPSNFNDSKNIIEILWDTLEITQGQSRSPLSNVSQLTLEPEDMDNPDEDLVIIGSGYLDIKNKFRERPSMTNGEYAELGQKVVDQLHNGDIEAALDFIYSKINENLNNTDWRTLKITSKDNDFMEEGTCGYSQTVDGEKLNTPGGTRGMSALNRTDSMGGSYNTNRYKY